MYFTVSPSSAGTSLTPITRDVGADGTFRTYQRKPQRNRRTVFTSAWSLTRLSRLGDGWKTSSDSTRPVAKKA